MVCCAAINCHSHNRKVKLSFYRFPSDPDRRKKWLINCRREQWTPKISDRLCEVHFESCQFEKSLQDPKIKKLKPNAVPTLFDVRNPPPLFNPVPRLSIYKNTSAVVDEEELVSIPIDEPTTAPVQENSSLSPEEQVQLLLKENKKLREKYENTVALLKKSYEKARNINEVHQRNVRQMEGMLQQKEAYLKKFLNEDQIKSLAVDKMKMWNNEGIIKGLKLRFMLGVHGYTFLHQSGYPIPSYSTLCRRVQNYQITSGIFKDLLDPLKYKISCMEPADRYCAMSIDEMAINSVEEYRKHQHEFVGYVTLGDQNKVGMHILAVLIRGIRMRWKQLIACEITSSSVDCSRMENCIRQCITYVENCGLQLVSLTSDMGGNNVSLWSHLKVVAHKNGTRVNHFEHNEHPVYIMPDVCHLLKNLKSTLQTNKVHIPKFLQEEEKLPTAIVDAEHVRALWTAELKANKVFRSLHHLKYEDIYPSNFDKMNVGRATRFFSCNTAAALELAVQLKTLPVAALTTAYFIRLIR